MSEAKATLIGAVAILLWGSLALFTVWTAGIPPFQLVAMSFLIAFCLAAAKWTWRRENWFSHLRQPLCVIAFGVAGLFGYHFFYFLALKNAPPVEAGLIAYLWPLLIVLFSALLPGERLKAQHVGGAALGLLGCGLLLGGVDGFAFDSTYTLGYAAAGICAVTWSSYSVLSRRFGAVPTDTVGWFCGATAVLGLIAHLLFEETVIPSDSGTWLAILALGLGPVGLAFFAWDIGMKRGRITTLGAASYGAPLLSTLLLIAIGGQKGDWSIVVACILITGGAVLASLDLFRSVFFSTPKRN